MAVSPYFKHISAPNEQSLIDDLTVEAIYQRGINMYYITREESSFNFDYLFGEDPENNFGNYVEIEMWCENLETGFEGQGSMVTRFALDINDEVTFQVSKTRFLEEIQKVYPDITRPREGDLIAFPMTKSIFEINFVEHEHPFYTAGKSNLYVISAQKFRWSHEDLNTGLDDIDAITNNEQYEDNTDIQIESDTFINHSESDPFSEGNY